MVFYKGGITYIDAMKLSISEIYNLQDCAIKINNEIERESRKHNR